jgi:hypothetical protein
MIHPDTFTAELVSRVLDGLETVALSPHEEQRVRSSAVYWLANLKGDANQTRFGIVARLERIFWESGSRAVEMAVIRTLPSQSDRRAAANVLEKIAMRDDEGELPNSYDAARHLLGLGDEGRAAILRLHSSGAIKNGSTRSFVADVVARNFQPRR